MMMKKNPLKAMGVAIRGLWRNWRVALVLMAAYGSLLATLYLFISTKEATALQVLLTLFFAALAPALFFMLQAMVVGYARGEARALVLLRRSLTDSCRLALASLPLILLALCLAFALNRLQYRSDILLGIITPVWAIQESWFLIAGRRLISPAQVREYSALILATLRFLLFGMALPLLAIHLWSETARDGLLPVFKRAHRAFAPAFHPQVVSIYALGLILFAIIPYFLLFSRPHAWTAGVEIGLFITRLLLVFLFTIFGWTITVSALRRERER
ncbi:MAG TPA: hypothetical protein VGX92_17860 [Pyrinomonadaceae bacterium]|jgi:hypothetical protein|nr:hypothetical protein [Pyrinomonadaceae bacterium]